ncbi:flavin-binding monooxygenase [Flexivirga endophytica]|uniref:Flavin-binding monooxygenase n=1 Tax=Flexivirga endophytica TaxID=1849103 RepID=A0A916WPT9_9MICO|nr:NAD(P)/FAD-dependent oxidoreductase [Flexivirga endophytica]GGB18988.1 flavin-binding monooxygenase [Flexivirga endophytica]GHB36664.1 flavin-binding monooxygenase [Flexivirga endophytica]
MPSATTVDPLDVLIIGAGISGIGAGHYLRANCPGKSFAILEGRAASGGTWDLFRYPGIRSDSDLHTFGYDFKPWRDKDAIADGAKILDYLREAATADGLDELIHFNHNVIGASWDSAEALWTVDAETPDGPRTFRARWIFAGTGYYNYDEGYTPDFPGREDFTGTIVHPQHWPEDLDHAGKKVVVVGSGATAVTLVPAMTTGPQAAAHVTMLQRTPTFVTALPREDKIAQALRRTFGEERGYQLTRRKNIAVQHWTWRLARRFPGQTRALLRKAQVRALPEGYDVDKHFNPPYDPWDQRLCVVPDGDLFRAIRSGRADVVTDHIETFTPRGIRLTSGEELEADIIITATGLNLRLIGGIPLTVDGAAVHFPETVAYRGLMLSGVPNLALSVGYTNASWTLKVGLLCEYFTRLLRHMDTYGYDAVTPEADPTMPTRPLLDFAAGYIQRSIDDLPRQGDHDPWATTTGFPDDVRLLRNGPVNDACLRFSSVHDTAPATITEPATLTEPVEVAS